MGFQLDEETEADICSDDPWIILHKLDSPSKMRYVGARVAACRANATAAAHVVPASIATWVAKIGAYQFFQIHPSLRLAAREKQFFQIHSSLRLATREMSSTSISRSADL